ncbi:MAG: DUF2189 domain-containing protein [Chromatiales bacterium]|nr:DUF2189 domain-containing protein [Chromatiales bacterium]
MAAMDEVPPTDLQMPGINQVSAAQPWTWIAAGATDLRRAPGVSLGYGAIWAGLSVLLTAVLYALGLFYWLLPMLSGFMFLGPMVAVGTYAISQDLAAGRTPGIGRALGAWRRNPMQLALMGLALLIFMIAWIRIATLLFALFFGIGAPDPARLYSTLLLTPTGLGMVAVGTAVGAVLAFGAFAISVVALPMLMDRQVSMLEAVVTSLRCVALNSRPMLLWAALLTLFVLVGMLTFFVGLVLLLPLLGHASWHAYRDLVQPGPR